VRARVAALFTALLTAAGMLAVSASGPASAQSPFPGSAAFSGYATGATLHVDAVQGAAAGPRVVDAELAFSGESANTAGLGSAISNEMSEVVQPAQASKNSYGRGSGVELGLGTTLPADPAANQLILAGLAQQAAAPTDSFGATPDQILADGRVRKEVGPVKGDPLVYASLLRGEAAARWNPSSCILGAPLGYGLGYAADAQLLDASTPNADGSFSQPVIAADTGTPTDRTASQSKSFTYLRPNGDGTFGLVSEVHETIAPVTIAKGMAGGTTIEFLGEWVLRVVATGKPGGASYTYAPAGQPTPSTPIIQTVDASGGAADGTVTKVVDFQDIFGAAGVSFPSNPLLNLTLATDARSIQPGAVPDPTKKPPLAADGTSASAAVDVLSVGLVNPDTPVADVQIAGVRLGHMETSVKVPAGGIECPIPVSKTASPDPVNAGQNFTWTITIPTSSGALAGTDCDLLNISATDVATVLSGSPVANITGVSNGGTPSTGTVSTGHNFSTAWANLGNYHPGDPPIVVTISGTIPGNSGAGVLQNTVNVSATLGNCKGGAAGQDIVGNATVTGTALLNGAAVKGSAIVSGPKVGGPAVAPARLAETGEQPWIPVVGGGLLLGAMALWRGRRRLHPVRVKQ